LEIQVQRQRTLNNLKAYINVILYRRLVGTQFPPWTEGTDVWGVQHMTHPDLKEKVFAEWLGSPKLLEAVQQLIHTKHDDLQLGK
jgi:hypothetical protein